MQLPDTISKKEANEYKHYVKKSCENGFSRITKAKHFHRSEDRTTLSYEFTRYVGLVAFPGQARRNKHQIEEVLEPIRKIKEIIDLVKKIDRPAARCFRLQFGHDASLPYLYLDPQLANINPQLYQTFMPYSDDNGRDRLLQNFRTIQIGLYNTINTRHH